MTTQAQILELISELQEERGTAVVMITHDLGVVAEIADEVVVMYAARVAERAPVYELFDRPLHPYTWGLLGSLPRLEAEAERLDADPRPATALFDPPPAAASTRAARYAFDAAATSCRELDADARRCRAPAARASSTRRRKLRESRTAARRVDLRRRVSDGRASCSTVEN